jgi:hypothetical protein
MDTPEETFTVIYLALASLLLVVAGVAWVLSAIKNRNATKYVSVTRSGPAPFKSGGLTIEIRGYSAKEADRIREAIEDSELVRRTLTPQDPK